MKHNRFFVFLLALFILMSAALPAMAEDAAPAQYECEGFTYSLKEDGTAEIIRYVRPDKSVKQITLPEQLDGHTVSSIAGNPFAQMDITGFNAPPDSPYFAVMEGVLFSKPEKRLICFPYGDTRKEYAIPQGIQIIGEKSFYLCDELKTVTIPDSVTEIGNEAFYYCGSLKSIVLPGSVVSIGASAFSMCYSLGSVTFSEGLAFIGDDAFGSTALQSITLPDSVSGFGGNPFYAARSLTEIIVSPNHPCLEVKDGVLFCQNGEEKWLVTYPVTLSAAEYAMPEGVTAIADHAFGESNKLQSIALPDSLTYIGNSAFSSDGLQSIHIPEGVTFIGVNAFKSCKKLQGLAIPGSVAFIGENAFLRCADNFTLTVTQGSYGESWAENNGVPCVYPDANDWLNN